MSLASLEAIARRLGAALRASGWRLATAESSTGGLIGHAITMVSGSSDYYEGGVISYSNRAKEVELGVPPVVIEAHGAVSSEVAAAMAEGVRQRFSVDVGVSVTGIAGPEGATDGKPVGTHFAAVSMRGRATRVEQRVFHHGREGNKAAAAALAMELVAAEVAAAEPSAV